MFNRVFRAGMDGWEYEAEQWHAELIRKELDLKSANSTKRPGEDEPSWKL